MNVSYKGMKQALPAAAQGKLDRKFAKLSKMLEQRGEREAHVVVTEQRKKQRAEVTIQFYDHQLVGLATHEDQFTALSEALAKIEGQAVKQRDKWREKARRSTPAKKLAGVAASSAPAEATQKIYRVANGPAKPITLEEALLAVDGKKKRPYVAYRDADHGRLSVLIRREDGHFDLVEG